ncbi:MAG: GWxTD domain-containing protein [Calditrichae bacterium]|nr:GWxTD domain-containing protein [Calditrichia bacterium]
MSTFVSLNAQDVFNVDFDAARFSESDTTGRLEVYYSFYYEGMTKYVENGDTLIDGSLAVKISSQDKEKIFVNKSYSFKNKIDSKQNSITGILTYSLREGIYLCELKGEDKRNSESIDSISFNFTINAFNQNKFTISDIQFASSLSRAINPNSIFIKNNYDVLPNTSGIYGVTFPVLFFYSEFYNLDKGNDSKNLKASYSIINQYGETIFNKNKFIPTEYSSIVFAEPVNVSKYPSGSYQMILSLLDEKSGSQAKSAKRFTIMNPAIVDTHQTVVDAEILSSEFINMDDAELDKVFGFSRYIATKKEIEIWQSLSKVNEKRTYLYNFWKLRDEDPSTPLNRYKINFFARVEIANKRFETMSKEGWKTDRGRVFCIYGEPDEIERYPNETDTKPYEIWNYYNLESGVIFVFAEMYSFTDMNLIHSSKTGEVYSPDWRSKISKF